MIGFEFSAVSHIKIVSGYLQSLLIPGLYGYVSNVYICMLILIQENPLCSFAIKIRNCKIEVETGLGMIYWLHISYITPRYLCHLQLLITKRDRDYFDRSSAKFIQNIPLLVSLATESLLILSHAHRSPTELTAIVRQLNWHLYYQSVPICLASMDDFYFSPYSHLHNIIPL